MSKQKTGHPLAASSEVLAMNNIVDWSKDLPAWQRDALRRLCLNEALVAEDIEALTSICQLPSAPFQPLTQDHVRDSGAGSTLVALRSIHDTQNVNALAGGETLSFCQTGITIAYGDNGSGKSGYARILKRACRARLSRRDELLANVYKKNPGPSSALIDFSVSDNNNTATWTLNGTSDPRLSAISVFDSRSASIQVEQSNDVAYTPLPLKVLAALADSCQSVKQKLSDQIKALEKQTPAVISKPSCQSTTTVGKLMASLGKAKREQVEGIAQLTPAERERLGTLSTELAGDPARISRQLTALKTKLSGAITKLKELSDATSEKRVDELRHVFALRRDTQAAALLASSSLFAAEPLPNVGSDTWRLLWEAARHFSEAEAYAEQAFPVTGPEARCVLCLQQLGEAGSERMTRFEAFVQDESKRREADARELYDGTLLGLDAAVINEQDQQSIVSLLENDLSNVELGVVVRTYIAGESRRLAALREGHTKEPFVLPAGTPIPLLQLNSACLDLEARAAALLADNASVERNQLRLERDELTDREWFNTIKKDVLAELLRREEIAKLQQATRDTATNKITSKSTELAEKLVTKALRSQFAKEVARLGIAGLAIELRQDKTSQGIPYFRVSLINEPAASVGEVLSEGEHRCVAIAAFLAEVATADGCSGLVFDDPVSSLDHMHRASVAKRLAEEGAHRQVVVFTHDLAFLLLLSEECRTSGTNVAFRSINRGTSLAGYCDSNPPPNAQPVEKVIEGMAKHLKNSKIQHELGKKAEWYSTVRGFQEQLRTAWERAVENALSPVIRRLANKVDTKGLLKLTVLSQGDCIAMRQAFGRCSALLHSEADALNRPLPSPELIETEIKVLAEWVQGIQERQDKIKIVETFTIDTAV